MDTIAYEQIVRYPEILTVDHNTIPCYSTNLEQETVHVKYLNN